MTMMVTEDYVSDRLGLCCLEMLSVDFLSVDDDLIQWTVNDIGILVIILMTY